MADCKESTEETNGPRPQIIMKFDAPEESSENSTNEDTEGQSNEENSEDPSFRGPRVARKHSGVLAASKFKCDKSSLGGSETSSSTTTTTTTTTKAKSSLLRPSALSSVTTTSTASAGPSTVIKPAKLKNPFTKVTDEEEGVATGSDGNGATNEGETEDEKKSNNETKVENRKNDNKKCIDTLPKFLPLVTTIPKDNNETSVNFAVASNSSASSFVFGQNLKERVTVSSDPESSGFTKVLGNPVPVSKPTTNSTLNEAAQELEEANRANKRKYSQVTPLTGEEGETNILQINCKLFAFDKGTSGWQERGRGTLRLNDRDEESRLVGRASGTQRLVLNTKVWPGMTAERAGPKSLRLTAMDVQGDLKVFIVQAAPKEVDQLHSLLLQRVKRATERQPKKLATDH